MARLLKKVSRVMKNRIRVLKLKEHPELTAGEISGVLDVPRNTVNSILQRWKYPLLSHVCNKKGAGPPRLYSERWKRAVVRRAQAEPFWSASQIAVSVQKDAVTRLVATAVGGDEVTWPRVGGKTLVRKTLRCSQLPRRKKATADKEADDAPQEFCACKRFVRLVTGVGCFCADVCSTPLHHCFIQVVSSDEKRWCVHSDGPVRVWRREGQRYAAHLVSPCGGGAGDGLAGRGWRGKQPAAEV